MSQRPSRGSGAERARLQAIRAVDLDDARPVFERIARTARRLTGAPMAQVSLIGATEIWIAGVANQPFPTVARGGSFAELVVERDEVLWIEDVAQDARVADYSLVRNEPRLRCYVGAPIVLSNGSRIGALSVIYGRPRPHDAELAAALADLAGLVALEWERGRAMKALKASEARERAAGDLLARVIDTAPVGLIMTDRRLRVLRTSQAWRREVGDEAGSVGRSLYDVFPGSRDRWGADLRRALKGESLSSRRTKLEMPDGSAPWMRIEVTPWRDRAGKVGGLLIMTYDITDMVEAMDRMRRSEQTLKLAIDIGELSMWELDHRDRQLNSAGPAVVEYARNSDRGYDSVQANIWTGVHPADRPAAMAAWERYEREGEPFRATFRMMQPDGPHIWVSSATEQIRDEFGRIERTVGVLRNIDRQKRSEMALAKARDAAEAANRAKSEFLANMSHEIRTPLNGVMGVASALARTGLTANQREMVGLIESSARTLESLLSDVLDLARVESGRLTLANEPFDLRRCISDVGALFQPSAEAKNLDLVVEPSVELEGVFLGDAARVRQILSNLVSNAVKFTPSGEVRIGGAALRTPHGIEARVWVKDTGIGFDDETKRRLFGRFEQADGSITRRYGGTGLGLAISRSLAERMGGGLDAEASPGAGAVFTLSLPLTRAEAPAEADHAAAYVAPAGAERPLKVLLAEDHPTNRRVVQLILESAGVDLTCVENGALAVEAWSHGDFDLVLMDMQMPVMDGLTAIRRIREREAQFSRPRTLIHALTANAMPEHAKASRAAGADGHLTKPVSAEALFGVVQTAARAGPNESTARQAG